MTHRVRDSPANAGLSCIEYRLLLPFSWALPHRHGSFCLNCKGASPRASVCLSDPVLPAMAQFPVGRIARYLKKGKVRLPRAFTFCDLKAVVNILTV